MPGEKVEQLNYKQLYRDQLGLNEALARQLMAAQANLSKMEHHYGTQVKKLLRRVEQLEAEKNQTKE